MIHDKISLLYRLTWYNPGKEQGAVHVITHWVTINSHEFKSVAQYNLTMTEGQKPLAYNHDNVVHVFIMTECGTLLSEIIIGPQCLIYIFIKMIWLDLRNVKSNHQCFKPNQITTDLLTYQIKSSLGENNDSNQIKSWLDFGHHWRELCIVTYELW